MLPLIFMLFVLTHASLCDVKKNGDGICHCNCGTRDTDCTQNVTLPDCGPYMQCVDNYCRTHYLGIHSPFYGIWRCAPERYGDGVCDCGCGSYDIDCINTTVSPNCHDNETCVSGRCVFSPDNSKWTCRQELYADSSVCHCNCGLHDPDCDELYDTLTRCSGYYLESDCGRGSVCSNDNCTRICPVHYEVTTIYDEEMFAFCYTNGCQPICGDGVYVGDEQCEGGVGCQRCRCSEGFYPTSPLTRDCKPICGDGIKTSVEACDGGLGCDNCSCQKGYYPIGKKYCGYCGDHTVNHPEQCDGGNGCDTNCSCLSGYVSIGQLYCKYNLPDPNCTQGIYNAHDGVCCSKWCGQCGGIGCGVYGNQDCCALPIIDERHSCEFNPAPCIVSLCGNGRIDVGEECDSGMGCRGSGSHYKCQCLTGYRSYSPHQTACQAIQGDNLAVEPEECDGGDHCQNSTCLPGYVAYTPPRLYCGVPDPFCQTGIPSILTSVCCDKSCGMCYDSFCSNRSGGYDSCCSHPIKSHKRSCRTAPPPCLIDADDLKKIDNPPDPSCDRGIPSPRDTVCCAKSCGKCGGSKCGARPGGVQSCCEQSVKLTDRSCNLHTPPCVIDKEVYSALGFQNFNEDDLDVMSNAQTTQLLPYIGIVTLLFLALM